MRVMLNLETRFLSLKVERTEFVQLNAQRSKSIEAARRRAPTKNYNDDLRYSEINFVCIHGGKQLQKVNGLANGKHLCNLCR